MEQRMHVNGSRLPSVGTVPTPAPSPAEDLVAPEVAAFMDAVRRLETALASERARCERLEEHARRQEAFLSAVSHELQAP